MRVMDPAAARVARDVLADGAARREAFGDDLRALFGDGSFALKTGTSSGWRDAWTAAFTDAFTVVVWMGDPGGTPLGGLSGFEGAARPAVRILAAAHERMDALGIRPVPPDEAELARARVCAVTGLLAGPRCSHTLDERFARGTLPRASCEAHLSDGRVALPARYAGWIEAAHPAGFALSDAAPSEAAPRVEHPRDGARLVIDPRRPAAIRPRERGRREGGGRALRGGRRAALGRPLGARGRRAHHRRDRRRAPERARLGHRGLRALRRRQPLGGAPGEPPAPGSEPDAETAPAS
ncbi:MAG: hypothetical protein M5U28_12360 [Sandaracinaceae bacterium]|nr:hypothetical protein [Sandaracinaceae bacterium]